MTTRCPSELALIAKAEADNYQMPLFRIDDYKDAILFWRAAGYSIRKITKTLNENGVKTSHSTIAGRLKNWS